MFSLKEVDDLRAREQEREKKGATNSAPKRYENPKPCLVLSCTKVLTSGLQFENFSFLPPTSRSCLLQH